MASRGASIEVPYMRRKACTECGHLHRVAIADKCQCCRDDIARVALKGDGK